VILFSQFRPTFNELKRQTGVKGYFRGLDRYQWFLSASCFRNEYWWTNTHCAYGIYFKSNAAVESFVLNNIRMSIDSYFSIRRTTCSEVILFLRSSRFRSKTNNDKNIFDGKCTYVIFCGKLPRKRFDIFERLYASDLRTKQLITWCPSNEYNNIWIRRYFKRYYIYCICQRIHLLSCTRHVRVNGLYKTFCIPHKTRFEYIHLNYNHTPVHRVRRRHAHKCTFPDVMHYVVVFE
jgi:hypothetical protein